MSDQNVIGEIDLLPTDKEAWSEEDKARIGINLYKAAAMLAQSINEGNDPSVVVYMRLEAECPLYDDIRQHLGDKVDCEEDGAIEGVVSRVLLLPALERTRITPASFVPGPGEVTLVKLSAQGFASVNARLVIVQKTGTGHEN